MLEIEARIFLLGLQEHIAISDLFGTLAAIEAQWLSQVVSAPVIK
jgi:hypothetical protein